MKTIIPMQRVGEPACATTSSPRCGVVRWALTGLGVGVVSATAYLLLGGKYFVFIPRWANVVFYPGFLVGNAAYKWGLSREVSKVVGVLAMGLAYALLALLVRFAWSATRKRAAKRSSDRAVSPFSKSCMLAAASLMLLATGCVTHKVWSGANQSVLCEPATPPNLALFDATDRRDVLVHYDAVNRKDQRAVRRAYFVKPNVTRIAAGKKPRFVDPTLASRMVAIPLRAGVSGDTNSLTAPGVYAVVNAEGCVFTLHRPAAAPEAHRLPTFAVPSGLGGRVALTPLSMAADAALIGSALLYLGYGGDLATLDSACSSKTTKGKP